MTTVEEGFKLPEYKLEKPVSECVLYEKVTPEIVRITLNRPNKHNAIMAPDMFREVINRLEQAADEEEIKVVVLGGAGPSFTAGDDLSQAPYEVFGGRPGVKPSIAKSLQGFRRIEGDLVRSLLYHPKVIIGELHGWVIGIGQILLLGCDLAIAADDTRFSGFVYRVAFAGLEPTMELLNILHIGLKRDRELALTGRELTVQELKEWGYVNAVVPREKLEEETMRWAKTVALMPGDGLAIGKAYHALCLESLGVPQSVTGGLICHTLLTNLKWRPGEFNFLKEKGKMGPRETFKAREARWKELGF